MSAISQDSLTKLSDSQLLQRLDVLVQKERQTTLNILLHLIEIDRRDLYLERGYASLFEYCTRHLGYSESAANRRIKTARCVRDFPEVYGMLSANELNLTTVSRLAGILTEENKDELLNMVRFKSARQVEAIVARYSPRSVLYDRVRTIFLKKFSDVPVPDDESKADNSNENGLPSNTSRSGSSLYESWVNFTSGAGGKNLTTGSDIFPQTENLEQKFQLEFAVDPGFMEKVEEVKSILSTKFPRGLDFEQLFEVLLDEFLEKHSPERKIQRREKRTEKGDNQKKKQSSVAKTENDSKSEGPRAHSIKKSRHIPISVQDQVFARDQGRCTYVGTDNVRCNSNWNVQIDHITPYARGGDHTIQNLRLLCAKHNRHEAERIYGRSYMNQRMLEGKSPGERSSPPAEKK